MLVKVEELGDPWYLHLVDDRWVRVDHLRWTLGSHDHHLRGPSQGWNFRF